MDDSLCKRERNSNHFGDDDDVAARAAETNFSTDPEGELNFQFPAGFPRFVKDSVQDFRKCETRLFMLLLINDKDAKQLASKERFLNIFIIVFISLFHICL